MTITISNGQPGTQNVIMLTKSAVEETFEELCFVDGTHCSTTHKVTRESAAWLVRKAKEAGLKAEFYRDFA